MTDAIADVLREPAAVVAPSEPGRLMLDCRAVTKRYGARTAVDGVDLTAAPGETVGLLGPNGAGKTTTLMMIAGLMTPDSGEILVDGRPTGPRAPDVRRRVGFVPQDVALYANLSAIENLRFFGGLHGMGRAVLEERIERALTQVGLWDRRNDRIEAFSGGMQRRANIAVALVHTPDLLILDEPTVGVDPQSRNAIFEHVAALAETGVAAIVASHQMDEIERLCSRVVIIDQGRVIAEGSPRRIIREHGGESTIECEVRGSFGAIDGALSRLRPDIDASATDSVIHAQVQEPTRALSRVLTVAAEANLDIVSVSVREPDLETVFLHLTGRALRD